MVVYSNGLIFGWPSECSGDYIHQFFESLWAKSVPAFLVCLIFIIAMGVIHNVSTSVFSFNSMFFLVQTKWYVGLAKGLTWPVGNSQCLCWLNVPVKNVVHHIECTVMRPAFELYLLCS